ncbi:hypothetical protein H4S02_000978 [Coemansia sp. RSA 2611]|nr:hypothetical protein H4S02_000978 [Coemansia sp. RSA 2611]
MTLDILSDDILEIILSYVLPATKSLKEWITQMAPLSVNRRLRRLALPHAYRYAYITAFSDTQYNPVTASNATIIHTNIDMAAATGNLHWVRRVSIDMNYYHSTLSGLENVLAVFNRHSGLWDKTVELVASVGYDMPLFGFPNVDGRAATKAMTVAAKELVRALPSVSSVHFDYMSRNAVSTAFYSELLQGYAGQLRKCKCPIPRALSAGLAYTQLVDLDTSLDTEQRSCFPRVCPQTIQRLRVWMLPVSCTWYILGKDVPPAEMELPALTALSVSYSISDPYAQEVDFEALKQCKLRLPRLRYLSVGGPGNQLPLLHSAVLPERMNNIEITAAPAAILGMGKVVLPKTKKLMIRIQKQMSDNAEYPGLFAAVGRLFECADKDAQARLGVFGGIAIEPGAIRCPGLTVLFNMSPIRVDTLLRILGDHPRLKSLNTTLSADTDSQHIDLDVGIQDGLPIQPLNTALTALKLCEDNNQGPAWLFIQVIKYLVIRLPALQRLTASYSMRPVFEQFVAEHSAQFPHLSGIQFSHG